LINFNKLLLH